MKRSTRFAWPFDMCESVSKQEYDGYAGAIESASRKKGKGNLVNLERWYRSDLKSAILTRNPKFITGEELVQLVDWKLTRGKWRPRLLDFARGQDCDVVQEISRAAFKLADDGSIEGAIKKLSEMKGIGVATATAVLAAGNSSVPFMSDELMQTLLGKKDYTLPTYRTLLVKCAETVKELEASSAPKPDGGWTAEAVEQAAWARATTNLGNTRPGKRQQETIQRTYAQPRKRKASTEAT